jgi:hypothetical protein
MEKFLGKNWRTTLTGLGAVAGYAVMTAMSGGVWAAKDLVIIAGMAIIGKLAKDAGVTGEEK